MLDPAFPRSERFFTVHAQGATKGPLETGSGMDMHCILLSANPILCRFPLAPHPILHCSVAFPAAPCAKQDSPVIATAAVAAVVAVAAPEAQSRPVPLEGHGREARNRHYQRRKQQEPHRAPAGFRVVRVFVRVSRRLRKRFTILKFEQWND